MAIPIYVPYISTPLMHLYLPPLHLPYSGFSTYVCLFPSLFIPLAFFQKVRSRTTTMKITIVFLLLGLALCARVKAGADAGDTNQAPTTQLTVSASAKPPATDTDTDTDATLLLDLQQTAKMTTLGAGIGKHHAKAKISKLRNQIDTDFELKTLR